MKTGTSSSAFSVVPLLLGQYFQPSTSRRMEPVEAARHGRSHGAVSAGTREANARVALASSE